MTDAVDSGREAGELAPVTDEEAEAFGAEADGAEAAAKPPDAAGDKPPEPTPSADEKPDGDEAEPAAKTEKETSSGAEKPAEKPAESAKAEEKPVEVEPGPAAKRLAELAKPAAGEKPADEAPPAEKLPEPKPAASKPPPPAVAPDADFAATMKSVVDDPGLAKLVIELPDGDNPGKTKQVTVADVAKEFPDFAAVSVAIGRKMAAGAVEQAIKAGQVVDGEQFNALRQQIINVQFDTAMTKGGFPDWADRVRSKEFQSWLSTRPKGEQALMHSQRTSDALAILEAHKEYAAAVKAKVDAERGAQAKEKDRRDKLHGHSLDGSADGGKTPARGLAAAQAEDADEAFDKAAEELDEQSERDRKRRR